MVRHMDHYGGRITLIKSILYSILVFWMHLYMLLMAIIHNIDDLLEFFLWYGSYVSRKIHLV